MSRKSSRARRHTPEVQPTAPQHLLDLMTDGREFESLLKEQRTGINVNVEVRRAIDEIEAIRKRPLLCYLSNMVKAQLTSSRSIDYSDDLPFSEMIRCVPAESKNVDIMLVTPGGSAEQVAKFVDRLRARFEHVAFLLPDLAMSAGTIFALSGDEIVMDARAYLGPIDPQIPNRSGQYVPAQSLLTLIKEIQERGDLSIKKGQNPQWTDLQILRQIDGRDIGNAINASKYSIELVDKYLSTYKFRTWNQHSDGRPVLPEEKQTRATEIAELLCNHEIWKTHGRGITRDVAWQECRIKIEHPEATPGLDRAFRRFWAAVHWIFGKTSLSKILISKNYALMQQDARASNGAKP